MVSVKTTGGNKHLYYSQGGHDKQINVQGCKDNPNNDVVSMAIPSEAADPNSGNTGVYLGDAVSKFKDASIGDQAKREFLLGLLLLKRCR